jgi:hypothetical protein
MVFICFLQLLKEVCAMGRDPRFICSKPIPKAEPAPASSSSANVNDAVSSDDEETEEDLPVAKEPSETVTADENAL